MKKKAAEEAEDLANQVAVLREQAAKRSAEVRGLSDELLQHQAQSDEFAFGKEREIDSLNRRLNDHKQQLKLQESEEADQVGTIAKLRTQVLALQEASRENEIKAETAAANEARLGKELNHKEQQLEELTADNLRLNKAIEDMNAAIAAEHKAANKRIQDTERDHESILDEKRNELMGLKEDLAEAEKAKASLTGLLHAEEQEHAVAHAHVGNLKHQLEELLEETKRDDHSVRAKNLELMESLSCKESQCVALEEELSSLYDEVKAKDVELDDTRRRVDEVESLLATLSTEACEMKQSMDSQAEEMKNSMETHARETEDLYVKLQKALDLVASQEQELKANASIGEQELKANALIKEELQKANEKIAQLIEENKKQIAELIEENNKQIAELVEENKIKIAQLIAENKNKIAQLMEENKNIAGDLEAALARVTQLERVIGDKDSDAGRDLEQARQKIDDLMAMVQNHVTEARKLAKETDELRHELGKSDAEVGQLKEREDKARDKIASLGDAMKELDNEIETLKKQLHAKSTELKKKVLKLEGELEVANEKLSRVSEETAKQAQELKVISRDKEEVEEALEGRIRDVTSLEKKLASLQALLSEVLLLLLLLLLLPLPLHTFPLILWFHTPTYLYSSTTLLLYSSTPLLLL